MLPFLKIQLAARLAHALFQISLPPGQEPELPSMVIECCSQERTYSKFYGLIGERFAKLNQLWTGLFEEAFAKYYDAIHRYETNRLRNIARFFGHLLGSDAIGWHVMSVVHMNEDETTSSSRIFIKILFQELSEAIGMGKLQERLKDDFLRPSFEGLFPRDNPRNTRFSINYFTSIGMGQVTEEMREHLKNLPRPTVPALPVPVTDSDSESVSSGSTYSSSYTGSSRSYSRSHSPARSGGRVRGRSYSRSLSRSPRPRSQRGRAGPSMARTPSPVSRRRRKYSSSRSPSRSRPVSRTPPGRAVNKGKELARSYSVSSEGSYRAGYGANNYRRRTPSGSLSRSPTPPWNSRRKADFAGSRRRSYTRSISPPQRAKRRERSISYSPIRSDARKGNADVRYPQRKISGGRGSESRSPPRRRWRGNSRSASPRPRVEVRRQNYSPSPPPKRRAEVEDRRVRRGYSPSPVRRRRSPSYGA
jgi:pre-mRNA-splicing factor CWC22